MRIKSTDIENKIAIVELTDIDVKNIIRHVLTAEEYNKLEALAELMS